MQEDPPVQLPLWATPSLGINEHVLKTSEKPEIHDDVNESLLVNCFFIKYIMTLDRSDEKLHLCKKHLLNT